MVNNKVRKYKHHKINSRFGIKFFMFKVMLYKNTQFELHYEKKIRLVFFNAYSCKYS